MEQIVVTVAKTVVTVVIDPPSATAFAIFGWIVVLGLLAFTLSRWWRSRQEGKK